jgi:Bacterial Ig-like domain (group 3)
MDGATQVGSTQTVAAGSASVTAVLADGSHSLTAVFTPTDATSFTASTSTAVAYTVTPPAGPVATTTALGVMPASPAASGATETLTATVSPSGAAGSVTFMDGATQVGSTQTVAAGSASVTAVLADGAHSLTAVFTPTDATAFTASTSTAVPYDVTPVGATATTTALDVTPASPATSGATETLTATVSPADAAGSVAFMDGATQVGSTQTVAAGSASVTAVLADGSHSLTAVFTPTDPTAFAASTSPTVDYTVTSASGAVTTSTGLDVTPASPAASGATETLTATVTPSDAAGTVAFMDGATQVGSTQTVSGGMASVSPVLADGSHSLTAVFTPTDPTAFTASTSAAVAYTVNGASNPHRTRLHLTVGPGLHAQLGDRVWFRASIDPRWAHGTVEFFSGGRLLGVAHLKNGAATFSTDDLKVGSHGLWARYVPFNPDNFQKSASNSVRYVIVPNDCKAHHHDWDD